MFKIIKESIDDIDEERYRQILDKFKSLTRDDCFQIGDYGEVKLPSDSKERSWMIMRVQEIQECLEELKGILM